MHRTLLPIVLALSLLPAFALTGCQKYYWVERDIPEGLSEAELAERFDRLRAKALQIRSVYQVQVLSVDDPSRYRLRVYHYADRKTEAIKAEVKAIMQEIGLGDESLSLLFEAR